VSSNNSIYCLFIQSSQDPSLTKKDEKFHKGTAEEHVRTDSGQVDMTYQGKSPVARGPTMCHKYGQYLCSAFYLKKFSGLHLRPHYFLIILAFL